MRARIKTLHRDISQLTADKENTKETDIRMNIMRKANQTKPNLSLRQLTDMLELHFYSSIKIEPCNLLDQA